jgi:hypothetical protein
MGNGKCEYKIICLVLTLQALVTFVLPPLVLRMAKGELLVYVSLALLMGPAIHIFFSFFFGWHEYMPLFHVPWWKELWP